MPDRLAEERFFDAIRHAGGRVTAAKRAVVLSMLAGLDHPSADDIAQKAREIDENIGRSSVYRILDELESLGLIAHSHLLGAAVVYHVAGQPHGHLTCTVCGETQEIAASAFGQIVNTALAEFSFHVDEQHVAISGVCAHCRDD
jgi:Fur family ferric uptake transcriptional regulator